MKKVKQKNVVPYVYRQRLLKLANFLDALPRKKFDLCSYVNTENVDDDVSVKKNLLNCGTTACAIGWCPTVFPRHFCWVYSSPSLRSLPPDSIVWPIYHAGVFFGFDCKFAENLFSIWSQDVYKKEPELVTPKHVARVLKKLATTGILVVDGVKTYPYEKEKSL